MKYESMNDNAINVEVDRYLSAISGEMRQAYDLSKPKHWGALAKSNKISVVYIEDKVMAFCYFGCLSNEWADGDIGRAVSICYLRMMKSK